jgi:hypothetical protein
MQQFMRGFLKSACILVLIPVAKKDNSGLSSLCLAKGSFSFGVLETLGKVSDITIASFISLGVPMIIIGFSVFGS